VLLSGLGIGNDVVVAALGQGEPGGRLGPGDDLAVPGLPACLVGGLPGGFGLLALAEVVVDAAEEQCQPSDGVTSRSRCWAKVSRPLTSRQM
jgi:hypothetical protein